MDLGKASSFLLKGAKKPPLLPSQLSRRYVGPPVRSMKRKTKTVLLRKKTIDFSHEISPLRFTMGELAQDVEICLFLYELAVFSRGGISEVSDVSCCFVIVSVRLRKS